MKKRVIALMLAFVLVLNMGTVAFANGEATPAPVTETEPTPTPAAEATPTPTPVVEETPTPTPAADPTPTSTPAVEATPTPTPTPEVVLASIRVTQMPDKLEYLCTDTAVDSTGGTLMLTFSDGTTQVVDLSAATLSLVKENANTASVNVAYEGMTDSFAVTVTHSYDEGTVTTEATATEPGVMTYTCADCGDEQTGELPMVASTEIASGTCGAEGDNLTWTLNEDGVLTITGTGMMADYTDSNGECDSPWYIYRESINSIVIDGNITCIGNYAFYGCSKITNIAINSQIGPVGDYAFYGCSSLTSIVLPENVWRIGCYAFSGCNGLTSITMPASVRIYSEAFDGCSSITNATLTKGTGVVSDYTDNRSASVNYYGWTPWLESKQSSIMVTIGDEITHIGKNAFYHCDNLADLIMPASVSFGIQAFSGCTGIKNVLLTKGTGVMPYYGYTGDTQYSSTPWNVSKQSGITVTIEDGVTNIGENAFKYCDSLSSIFIPDSVKTIDTYAFYGCTELVNISMSGVTNIGEEAFFNCYKLTSILLPDSLTNIGEKAFSDCSKLTSITMPASARIREDAFNNCTNISNVTLTRGTGEMLRYTTGTSSGELRNISSYQWTPWYESEQNNITVTIEDGVNNIGKQAFYRCDGLTSISIPRSITSIGEEAFYNCSDLTAVHIDNLDCWVNISFHGSYTNPLTYAHNLYLDNMLVTDVSFPDGIAMVGNYTFAGATCIKTVSLPDSVASIADYAFGGCSGLTSITMPVSTDIYRYAFGGCTGVTSVTLTKGNGVMPEYTTSSSSSVTKNSYTFTPWYISRNNSITMTVETGITSLGSNTFYNCTGLSAVYVDSLDAWLNISFANNTSNPLSYAHDLYLNDALVTEVTFPADTTEVKPYVFAGGSCLTKINITEGIATIGTDAFKNCSALTEIEFEGNAPATIYNSAFKGVTATAYYYKTKNWTEDDFQDYGGTITWVEIDNEVASGTCGAEGDNLTWTLDSDGVLTISGTGAMKNYSNNHGDQNYAPWHDYTQKIKSVVIDDGATTIGEYAFLGCSVLADITIPDSVKRIEGGAFSYCNALESIELPADLEYLGNSAFLSCVRLTNVNIPSSIKKIGEGTFYGCRSLAELVIPDGVTAVGELAFEGCVSLTTINIPLSVKNIGGGAFIGCSSLKTLTVHEDVAIGSAVFAKCGFETAGPIGSGSDLEFGWTESIPDYAFEGCNSLKNVIIPSGVKNIGAGAFRSCTALAGITIPAGVETIQDRTFYGCSNIAEIVIPANVNSIGEQAFLDCSALTSITIPGRIKSIGSSAFWGCSNLKEIKFEGDAPAIDEYVFNEVTATAYYLHTKEWEEEDLQNYGGKITWQLCCENFEECEVIKDEAVEPTFDSTGLTEGSHCSVCEKPIVAQNELPKLAVTELEITAPDKLVYYKGESLDSTGLTVTAKLNNDTNIDVTDQVQLEGFSSNAAGTKTITVSFKDAQATFDVQVFSFTSVSLSLEGRVIINFYANFPGMAEAGYTPGILFFREQPDGDEIVAAYNAGEGVTSYVVADNGALMFSYDKLAAKELNDKVYATLYAVQDDGKVVFGTPTPISAAEYAISTFGLYANDARLQTLMVDMLNFGAAAQNEFDYRTNALANSNMSATMAAKATKDNVSLSNGMKLYKDGLSSDKVTIKSASLSLDNEISINFYAEIKGDIKKAELLIFDEYTAGGVYDKNTASKRTDMVPHEDMYAGFITGIAAKSMRDLYYARVYVQFEDGTEAYSGIGQYSVESYAWQVRNGSGFSSKLKLLMEEMMKYGDSAKMYMENKNNNANG